MKGHPSRHRRTSSSVLAVLALALSALVTVPLVAQAAAADPCGPDGNKITCENSKPGTDPSVWDIQGAGDSSIQGFSTDISVNVGSTIGFKVDTDASSYAIDIYRLGWYDGDGARKITSVSPSATLPQRQPQCINDLSTQLYDCGNWALSASWSVPSTAVSGVYIAKLTRTSGDSSHITFVVRDESSRSDLVFQTSDPTWQAYNNYGGSDFYKGGANGRAYKLSYNRPVTTRSGLGGRDFFFSNEYPLVRFLERNGYDTTYISGVDTDRLGGLLTNHKAFLSVGHDEYWSAAQRRNVETARDAGVHLLFLSGNEVYWHTRYEKSIDASATPYRTLVTYKETWQNSKFDPAPEWTGTWRDPRFASRAQGAGRPENGLTGQMYQVNNTNLAVKVSAAEGALRLWRNTSLASLPNGTTATLAPHTVGYESDEDIENADRPQGLIRLSTTTGAVDEYLKDYGNDVGPGQTTHHLTLYRAPSGALVFGAGSVQWTWGLDGTHDSPYLPEPADVRMQQAQVNLLADMSVQPKTLMAGLVAATKSADTTGPTTTITAPAAAATLPNGSSVTTTGTASDAGGGRVAAVEVSTDGGSTWHPATGTTSWSYTYFQRGSGSTAIKVRAVDDSANIGQPTSRSVAVSCPCSVFGQQAPVADATPDPSAVELGLRFTPSADGFVQGIRFFKNAANTGTHTGSLWTTSGQRLATVTFTGETASGWQTAPLSTPVALSAGTTYVVSYTAPQGRYSYQLGAFYEAGLDSEPLVVDGAFGATPAGVYGTAGQFPSSSFRMSNYFVDVAFSSTDGSPLIATNQWPLAGSSSVPVTTTVSAKYSKPLVAGSAGLTLTDQLGANVPGATAYDAATRTITFTPQANLAGFVKYTATLQGTDSSGGDVGAGKTWTFTTVKPPPAPGVCPCTVFDDSTVPGMLDVPDGPVTLGMRFTADTTGMVTGVRFYKGVNNTGAHVGTLWSNAGAVLARGTFTDESTTGWQTLTFAQPVAITKNTPYVVSYRAANGHYSATVNGFGSGIDRPPLHVTSQGGAYSYSDSFPGNVSSASYLVDVVFEKGLPTLAFTSQDPAPGAVGVARGTSIDLQFSAPLAAGYSVRLSAGATDLAGTTTQSSDGTRVTFRPSALLPADTLLTVRVTNVTSAEGAVMADQSWTFRTRAPETPDHQTLFGDQVPAVSATPDGSSVEVGAAFRPNVSGAITKLRFFKGPGNLGTHVGSLWTTSGTLLGRATFTNETASGWQSVTLSTPVQVSAGTTYVVSYLAPQGHYSYTSGFFNSPWTAGDLSSPTANNGRYAYGAGAFPTFSYGAANYFVDVVFERPAPTMTVSQRSPAPGATSVSVATQPWIALSAPVAPGWSMTVTRAGTPVAGAAALSPDGQRITFAPAAALPTDADYTVTVQGVVSTEGVALPTQTWTFRTETAQTQLATLFGSSLPANASIADNGPIELGTVFTPTSDGTVTDIRFFKGEGNTGTHTGSIWSSSGVRLATVTFTQETGTGWQTASLATPLSITAGTSYVVSYYAPNGRYSATGAFFASKWTSGPLTAPAGANGRYRYGAGGGFPTGSYNSTNYFVDVVMRY